MQGLADTGSILFTSLRDEHHVAGQVTGSLVVFAVRDLPGEVWDQQERVADPANSVVQDLGGRESLVATFVGQNPDTGTNETLHNGVHGPEGDAGREKGHGLWGDIVVEDVEDRGQYGHIPENIV